MMNSYCLLCKKGTESINPKIVRTKNNRLMMLLKCAIYNNKKSRFTAGLSSLECISQGPGLLDNLELNTPQNRMKNALWNAFR